GITDEKVDIITRAELCFVFDSDAGYVINFLTGAVEDIDYTITSDAFVTTLAMITSQNYYSFEVAYANYDYVKTVYDVTIDRSAPNVTLSYESKDYEFDDIVQFNNLINDLNDSDTPVNPPEDYPEATSVNDKVVASQTTHVLDATTVTTPELKLELPDKAGVKQFRITRDGELVSECSGTTVKIYRNGVIYKIIDGKNVTLYEEGRLAYFYDDNTIKIYDNTKLLRTLTYVVTGNRIDIREKTSAFKTITFEKKEKEIVFYENDVKVYSIDTSDDDPYKIKNSGDYSIFAEDKVGNKTEFLFTKSESQVFSIEVDGGALPEYGNNGMIVSLFEECELHYIVVSNGNPLYYALRYKDGQLRAVEYYIVKEDDLFVLEEIDGDTEEGNINYYPPVFDTTLSVTEKDVWYDVGDRLLCLITSDGVLKLKLVSFADEEIDYSLRVKSFHSPDPLYKHIKISHTCSDVTFENTYGDEIVTNKDGETVYLNSGFRMTGYDEAVISVNVYYSQSPSVFEDPVQVYKRGSSMLSKTFVGNGYYKVAIDNVYGNHTEYFFTVSDTFNVSVTTEYKNGTTNYYGFDNKEDVFRANFSVKIEADGGVVKTVKVTEKDENGEYVDYVPTTMGIVGKAYVITFTQEGDYRVVIADEYGNVWDKKVEILARDILLADGILTGFNPDALRLSEGYTNTALTIDTGLLTEEIKFVGIRHDGRTTAIYDLVSENKIPFDETAFHDILGKDGNGVYDVIFCDEYGNSHIRTIHYSATTTLKAERTTRRLQENEAYSDELLRNGTGLWTNSSFTLTGNEGVITVNGEVVASPYEKKFVSEDGKSYSEYNITYVDYYGFKYSFVAYLSRTDVELYASDSSEIFTYGEEVVTTKNLSVSYGDNVRCVYYLDGVLQGNYPSGKVLRKDGLYRFVAEDLAGNTTSYIVKRDTVCKFTFKAESSDKRLISGDVVNDKVLLSMMGEDNLTVKLAVLNGEKLADFSSTRIDADGKWEFLLSDQYGNTAYFYIFRRPHRSTPFPYT
ncbi:MAG: hypothetical protein MJ072_00855, partial [Clostridia bacterium]|nr:hypothetical protein [Clostridia bacterium]